MGTDLPEDPGDKNTRLIYAKSHTGMSRLSSAPSHTWAPHLFQTVDGHLVFHHGCGVLLVLVPLRRDLLLEALCIILQNLISLCSKVQLMENKTGIKYLWFIDNRQNQNNKNREDRMLHWIDLPDHDQFRQNNRGLAWPSFGSHVGVLNRLFLPIITDSNMVDYPLFSQGDDITSNSSIGVQTTWKK